MRVLLNYYVCFTNRKEGRKKRREGGREETRRVRKQTTPDLSICFWTSLELDNLAANARCTLSQKHMLQSSDHIALMISSGLRVNFWALHNDYHSLLSGGGPS